MGINFTQFLSYHDIDVKDTDLFEDAWGLNSRFCDVIDLLCCAKAVPERDLTDKLIDKIRKRS